MPQGWDFCIFVLKDCSFMAKVEWKKRKLKKKLTISAKRWYNPFHFFFVGYLEYIKEN